MAVALEVSCDVLLEALPITKRGKSKLQKLYRLSPMKIVPRGPPGVRSSPRIVSSRRGRVPPPNTPNTPEAADLPGSSGSLNVQQQQQFLTIEAALRAMGEGAEEEEEAMENSVEFLKEVIQPDKEEEVIQHDKEEEEEVVKHDKEEEEVVVKQEDNNCEQFSEERREDSSVQFLEHRGDSHPEEVLADRIDRGEPEKKPKKVSFSTSLAEEKEEGSLLLNSTPMPDVPVYIRTPKRRLMAFNKAIKRAFDRMCWDNEPVPSLRAKQGRFEGTTSSSQEDQEATKSR